MSSNIVLGKVAEASTGGSLLGDRIGALWEDHMSEKRISSEYEGYCIILDAGHGGNDGGTLADSQQKDVVEKEINLAVVLRMKSLLENLGAEVELTRETDETLSLDERVGLANSKEADLFVSIHCNYFEEDASVSGLECYYFEESDSGKQCAEKILETIADGGNVKTRNVKESDFYVLKKTKTPAVLVELGYLSNTKECRLLSEKEYQETLAEELVKGILASMK